jgi:hypothetical protein
MSIDAAALRPVLLEWAPRAYAARAMRGVTITATGAGVTG